MPRNPAHIIHIENQEIAVSECTCFQGETCSYCLRGTDGLLSFAENPLAHEPLIPGVLRAFEVVQAADSLSDAEDLLDAFICTLNEQTSQVLGVHPEIAGLEEYAKIVADFTHYEIFSECSSETNKRLLQWLDAHPHVLARINNQAARWVDAEGQVAQHVQFLTDPAGMMSGLDFVLDLFKKAPSPEAFMSNFMHAYKSAVSQTSEMILAQLASQFKIEGNLVIQHGKAICVNSADDLFGWVLIKKFKRQGDAEKSWVPSKEKASSGAISRAKQVWEYHSEVSAIPVGAARMNVANTFGPFSFQRRVASWMDSCFEGNLDIINDVDERNARFLEEAIELVQANGFSEEQTQLITKYVYGRPKGEPSQEIGGVMVTLAALANPLGHSIEAASETELARILDPDMQSRIREKQKSKPKSSPLPGAYPERVAGMPPEMAAPYGGAVPVPPPVPSPDYDERNRLDPHRAPEPLPLPLPTDE